MQVIADHLSTEEVEDIKESFKKMDTDNDGIVSIEELKSGLRKFGSQLAEAEVQMLIETVSVPECLILQLSVCVCLGIQLSILTFINSTTSMILINISYIHLHFLVVLNWSFNEKMNLNSVFLMSIFRKTGYSWLSFWILLLFPCWMLLTV